MDLAKLKKLEAKASPAPWWQDAVDCEDGHGHYKAYCVGYEHKSILDTANSDVQLIEQDDGPRYDITGHYDTEFIAEMRNATPKLIARVQDLELIAKTLNSLSVERALRIEALEDALQRIVDFHIGDCPAAVEEIDFAKNINREIRKIAHTALERTGQASSQPDTNEQTKGKSP